MIGSSTHPRLAAASLLAVLCCASTARAEPRAGALAQALFEEGVALMEDGHFDEACPKLAESQRLDPGGGTLLNLASCLERLGQLASSYATYSDALSAAIRDGRKEREAIARERLAAIQPLLSRLDLRVTEETREAEIMLDGTRLGPTAWATHLPIDPGKHTLSASAKDRVTWSHTFEVTSNEQRIVVEVPKLAHAAVPLVAAPPTSEPDGARGALRDPHAGRRTAATVALVGGGVFVGLGAVAGAFALAKKSASDDGCETATTCTADGASAMRTAETLAWTSNVAIGLGLAAAVTGAIFLFTTPRSTRISLNAAAFSGSF